MMVRHLRKYHIYHEFRKMNLKTNSIAMVRDKNKIEGAYLLMKRFKNRLKAFDTAMQVLNETKANVTDFDELRAGLDFTRTENVFRDMMSLIDTTTKNFEAKVEHERAQTTSLFQRLLLEQQTVTATVEQKIQKALIARIESNELQIQNLGIELGKQASRGPRVDMSFSDEGLFPKHMQTIGDIDRIRKDVLMQNQLDLVRVEIADLRKLMLRNSSIDSAKGEKEDTGSKALNRRHISINW